MISEGVISYRFKTGRGRLVEENPFCLLFIQRNFLPALHQKIPGEYVVIYPLCAVTECTYTESGSFQTGRFKMIF
jgi:hypothetical protein